jgi:hypothetical protein
VLIGAHQFSLIAVPQQDFNPTAGPAVNPAFTGGTWNCTLAQKNGFNSPAADVNADASIADSFLGCFNPSAGVALADGASIQLGTVTYNVAGDDVQVTYSLDSVTVGDVGGGTEYLSCLSEAPNPACTGSSAEVGTVVATATPVPTDTPTVPPVTNTPCTGASCPTSTPQDYVTVTPTPGGETPTMPAGETPAGGETPGGPPPPTQPGGTTGGGGVRPITLPDTGAGDGSSMDWSMAGLFALAALAAGGLAGGAYYMAARRATAHRDGR